MKRLYLIIGALLIFTLVVVGYAKPAPAPAPAPAPSPVPTPAPAPEAEKVIVWKGQSCFPTAVAPYGPFGKKSGLFPGAVVEWTEWLERNTNGRLKIEWSDPGSMFPPAESDKAIGQGVADISYAYGGYYTGRIPEAYISSGIPFAYKNAQAEYEVWYEYGLIDLVREAYAEHNIMFFYFPSDAHVGMGTTFEALGPDDIKGRKIRAVGSWGEYVKALGGSPVSMTWPEIYMAMKLGTVDGWISGAATMEDVKLKEVTKYYIDEPGISAAAPELLINKDSFAALPEDIKELLLNDSKYVTHTLSYSWSRQNDWTMANAQKEYGVVSISWSAEDQARVTKLMVDTVWPEIAAKSPRTAECVELIKKHLRDYGKLD